MWCQGVNAAHSVGDNNIGGGGVCRHTGDKYLGTGLSPHNPHTWQATAQSWRTESDKLAFPNAYPTEPLVSLYSEGSSPHIVPAD